MNQNHFYFGRMTPQSRELPLIFQNPAPVIPPWEASTLSVGVIAHFSTWGSLSPSLPSARLRAAGYSDGCIGWDSTCPLALACPRRESMGIPEGQPGPELGGPMEFHGHLKSWIDHVAQWQSSPDGSLDPLQGLLLSWVPLRTRVRVTR